MNVNFSLGKCKTKAAYSAKLKQKGKLNLKKIAAKFDVVMETPILLVIKAQIKVSNKVSNKVKNTINVEIVVHEFGELLFKNCENVEFMEKTAKEIYKVGLSEH